MSSKTIFILALAVSAGIAKYMRISERDYPEDCNNARRSFTEEQLKNFTYDPENEEAGPYFEGDIEGGIPEDFFDRNGIVGRRYRWPRNTLVYSIDADFTDEQLESIEEAHRQITAATNGCIRFRERNNRDSAYVSIVNPSSGCSSAVGYQGRRQELKVSNGCFRVGWGTVAHEHMHALGFWHEHSREDRDDWVSIVWQNIEEGKEHNFCKNPSNAYNERYDYGSIMHYNLRSFGIDNSQTIIPSYSTRGIRVGQRDAISEIDARKIMKMYGCM